MSLSATAGSETVAPIVERGSTRNILTFVYFIFIVYFSIGLPLAVLPPFIHLRMGYSAMLAGLAISIQYVATLASRPWAGRISDRLGAKVAVSWGMASCTASGAMIIAAAALHNVRWLSFAALIVSRLFIGIGESLGSTGSTLWGISSAGPENTARVIGWAGICTYGAMGLSAPLGVILDQRWGLASIGILTILFCGVSLVIAMRKDPVPVKPGEHLPFASVLGRVAPHGMGLALGGVAYSVLATFVTLFYASRHWSGAALCLTVFGVGFIFSRVFFIRTINVYGGFSVARISLFVESIGALLLWLSVSPWVALVGSTFCGLGFSLVFPSIAVEAVKRVPEASRGTALGVYTAFADVSFFLVGPVAGALIGIYGYASIFLFALLCVLGALGIVVVLYRLQRRAAPSV